jgi:hypothetical protein
LQDIAIKQLLKQLNQWVQFYEVMHKYADICINIPIHATLNP